MPSSFRRRLNEGLSKGQPALRGKLVPSDPGNLTKHDEEAIASAISALHDLSDDIKRYRVKRQNISSKLADAYWESGILDWLTYLFDNYWHPSDDKRWEVISCVSSVLEYFLHMNIYIIGDDEEERCLSLVTRLWFETAFDHLKSENSFSRGCWGPFLTAVEGYSRLPEGSVTREKILSHLDQVKGIPMVNLILKRLKLISKIKRTCTKQFKTLVTALSRFVLEIHISGKPLDQLIRRIADALHYIVYSILPVEHDLVMDSCLHLIVMIAEKMERGLSINAVRAALKGRYYQSIAAFSPHLDSLGDHFEGVNTALFQQQFKALLSHGVTKYIFYSSVREALRPAMDDDYCANKVQGTSTQEPWEALREEHRRLSLLNIEPEEKFLLPLCDNPFHGRKAATETLFRCSGCETARNCSKVCQREHWRFDHREKCRELRFLAITSSAEERLRMRDFHSVLLHTIPLALEELEANAERMKNENQEISESILYDYTTYPSTLSFEKRDPVAETLGSLIPGAIIVQCRVPLGTRVATITAASNIQEEGTIVWFAGQSYTTYVPATRGT